MPERPRPNLDRVREALEDRDETMESAPEPEPAPKPAPSEDDDAGDADP